MKNLLRFIMPLLLCTSGFGQVLNLDFAGNLNNTGTKNFTISGVGFQRYGPDRNGNPNCAVTPTNLNQGYIKISGMNAVNFKNPFSIVTWFRTYNNQVGQYIFTKGLFTQIVNEDYSEEIIPNGQLTNGGAIPNYTTTTSLSKTPWYHLALVYDGDTMLTYLNDTAIAKERIYIISAKSDTALIGYRFPGDMDQFQLYDYALSADQVDSLYQLPASCSNVVTSAAVNAAQQFAVVRNGEDIQVTYTGSAVATYSITDLFGREIYKGMLESNGIIPWTKQAAGMLLLRVNVEGKVYVVKI